MTIDTEESGFVKDSETASNQDSDEMVDDAPQQDRFGVEYACLKCGIITSGTEISRLPEIKCICGFKVFTKVRPPIVKTVHAI